MLTVRLNQDKPGLAGALDAVVSLAGMLTFLLGAVVVTGWYSHNIALLRVYPTFVAMAFNTAAGFLFTGGSLLALRFNRTRIAIVSATIVLLIGALTLIEYITHANLGIDDLMIRQYVRAGILNFARMAIGTALCFTLAGTAMLFLAGSKRHPLLTTLIASMSSVILGLGAVGLTGYFIGTQQAYAWGSLMRMAAHTAAGMIVAGIGLIAMSWRHDERYQVEQWAPLPITVATFVIAATLCLWQTLVVDRDAALTALREIHTRSIHSNLTALRMTEWMLPTTVLCGGFILALLTAWVVWLGQSSTRTAKQIARINDELSTSHIQLEERVVERTRDLEQANRAVRDILSCVTDGKFLLCGDAGCLPKMLERQGEEIPLTPTHGMRDLRKRATAAAAIAGLADERVMDLETAVGEAAMNAVVHAGGGVGWVAMGNDTVQVWVHDNGSGISMESLPRATLERGYTTAGTLGHGFFLILGAVDRFYLLTSPSGTTIVIEKDKQTLSATWIDRIAKTAPVIAEAA